MEFLNKKFSINNIYLASASPRRKEMLSKLGLNFSVIPSPHTDENYPDELPGAEIAKFLAEKKANSFGEIHESDIIITADTIVWADEKILEKPANYNEAFAMLKLLSNKTHAVISGVCIKSTYKKVVFDSETKVEFCELSDEEIHYYIKNFKPFDKAGAYGIQEWIGMIGINHIEGSFYNVVGLPIQKLYKELMMF